MYLHRSPSKTIFSSVDLLPYPISQLLKYVPCNKYRKHPLNFSHQHLTLCPPPSPIVPWQVPAKQLDKSTQNTEPFTKIVSPQTVHRKVTTGLVTTPYKKQATLRSHPCRSLPFGAHSPIRVSTLPHTTPFLRQNCRRPPNFHDCSFHRTYLSPPQTSRPTTRSPVVHEILK